MKKDRKTDRGMLLVILACVLFTAVIASPTARACLGDDGITLINGEIPGGG